MKGVPPDRRQIRLFPDYSRDWPLWESRTPTWDSGYTTAPTDYGLSEDLTRDMAAWNAFWEEHFDAFDGWDADGSREQWGRDGERVASRLREEVASFADVEYNPWPLKSRRPRRGSRVLRAVARRVAPVMRVLGNRKG